MEVALIKLTLEPIHLPRTPIGGLAQNHVAESQADVRADDHSLTFLGLVCCRIDNPN